MEADLHLPEGDWATFHPGPGTGITLMHAHFMQHVFERHSHPTYAIGITRCGVQTFHCRGTRHASLRGDVMLFNPDEPHDGSRGSDEGFGYTMLYMEPAVVHGWLDRAAGTGNSAYFRHSIAHDQPAAHSLLQVPAALMQGQESLRAETLTADAMLGLLQRHGESRADGGNCQDAGRERMRRVRDYIDSHFADDLTVETLAVAAGLSRVHLTRAFRQHFGVPPHVYLNSVRLRHAQQALLAGQTLTEAALAAGFADQSHFNRRFRGSMGVTPGVWLRQMAKK